MPFKSKSQRKRMFAQMPKLAKKWAKEAGKKIKKVTKKK